ncbi:MAG TPA: glycerol-3-phosphate 1-O-acyltransferase PlsY [Rhizomicrobium sp.]|nr:glycerol-3-phosphate 1-O-acyltransferase PlsY [Rhizomicrobium sp.]
MLERLSYLNWNADAPLAVAAFAFGYLLGSIPFGLLFARLAGAGDVRNIGSGNIGATNVLRTGKKWAAAATLICDMGKGAIAVIVAQTWGGELAVIAGIGVFLGHVFPAWLKFHGGKGVATILGIVLALDWRVGLLTGGTWLVSAALWRFSSLAALIAMAAAPVYFALFGESLFAVAALLLAILIFGTHRENIKRLLRGEEPHIGRKTAVRIT